MKRILLFLLFTLFFSSGLIGQMNNINVVYEKEVQFKPIIMKAFNMIGKDGAATDGYFVTMPSDISELINSPNDFINPEYLKLGKDLRFIFDGDKKKPGRQDFSFKKYQSSFCDGFGKSDKFIFVIKDAKRIIKDKLIVCGRLDIEKDGRAKNYAGFVMHLDVSNPASGLNNIVFFHNLQSVNSVEIVELDSWIFCGTTKPGTYENGTNGIIFRITTASPYNCSNYKQNWSYIFLSNNSLHVKVNNTTLNKIKPVGKGVYGVIGTTNENIYEADILFITLDRNGEVFGRDIWGRPYDSRKRIAYKEYGKSFISDMESIYPLGRYLEVHSPDEKPNVNHDDILVAQIASRYQYHFNDIIWSNRYEMYSGKDFSDIPEDIIFSGNEREPLAVLGNVKYTSSNYTGFILDLISNGNAHDLTIFGNEQSGVDMLFSITKSYNNTLVAAGISNTFSNINGTGTASDLWLVENYMNDLDTCYSIKRKPAQKKIILKRKYTKYNKITLEMSCCNLRLLPTNAKDEMICDNGDTIPPDPCICKEDIHIELTNRPDAGDTCAYDVKIIVDCNKGENASINAIQFEEMNGETILVYPPNFDWTIVPGGTMSNWTYKTPSNAPIPLGSNQFNVGFFAGNENCRNIIVKYLDYISDPDIPREICRDTIEICCPPCPTIEDVNIRCDSLYKNEFPTYEICVDVSYYGPSTDIYVGYSGPGFAGAHLSQISSPGTICFDFIDLQHLLQGTPILIETYFLDAAGNKYCIDRREIEIPDCCPTYGDISVECDEMTVDGQKYSVTLNVNNNWLSPVQVYFKAYPPQISPTYHTINPGNNAITLEYIDLTGYGSPNLVGLSSFVVLGHDTLCSNFDFFKLPPCDSSECNIFIDKDTCCCYLIKAINPGGKLLKEAKLNVTGGKAMNFTNYDGCSSTSTPMPSANVTWTYDPACSPIFWNYICFQSDNASGEIISSWTFTYDDGSTCTKLDTMVCMPLPNMSCDTLSFEPIPDSDEQEEIIRFTILNNKVPLSPICTVYVSYDPPTMTASGNNAPTSGGDFDHTGTPYSGLDQNRWRYPYNELIIHGDPNYPGDDPNVIFGQNISFNIGMNYFDGYDGIITFKVKHCDGQICDMTYDWKTHDPNDSQNDYDVKHEIMMLDSLICWDDIEVKPKKEPKEEEVSWVTVIWDWLTSGTKKDNDDTPLDENSFKLEAITGSVLMDGEELVNEFVITRQGQNSATFKLMKPRMITKENPIKFNLVFSGKMPENLPIKLALYDKQLQIIGLDSAYLKKPTIVQSNDGETPSTVIQMGKTYPNPASYSVTIDYYLSKTDLVTIELLDVNGKKLKTISNSYSFAGKNTITFNTYDVTTGDYFVRFRTSDGVEVVSKLVIIK